MTKFIVIDPCYLEHTDKEWTDYNNSIDWDNVHTGTLSNVFDQIEGIMVDNPIGDISEDEMRIDINPHSSDWDSKSLDVNLPCCDAAHHRIFALDDVKDRLNVWTKDEIKSGIKNPRSFRIFEYDANDIDDLANKASFKVKENHEAWEEDPYE